MKHQSEIPKNTESKNIDMPLQVSAATDFIAFTKDATQQSVAALFETQVRIHATRLALTEGERTITYHELNGAANRIAHSILYRLENRYPEVTDTHNLADWEANAEPIAVLLEQSIPAIVATFGVFKTGRVYLPIDPADPHTRIKYIFNHAPARIIITNNSNFALAEKFAPSDCKIINIDLIEDEVSNFNPGLSISKLSPALLIYTSGSVGQPKGVIHSQRNLLHDIRNKTNLFRFSPSDRLSLLAWGTGQAVKLIFSSLLNGASLHLYNLKRIGLSRLAAWMIRERITFHTITASICRSFLDIIGDDENFPDLRVVRTASDTIFPDDINRFQKHLGPHCFIVNALASSETGVICAHVMNQEKPIELSRIPIGIANDETEINLLDELGNRIIGLEKGRIAITGRHIAQGYWRQPKLTCVSFQPDPRDHEISTYKSSDLARWRTDGSLEFLGRSDFQVKIRGYHVDITEVEATLMKNDNIVDAVVQACEFERGEKRLVGYIVPRSQPAPTSSCLYRFLQNHLSDYMIPASFIILKEIPLLPTGKTNRSALPQPGHRRPVLENEYVAPKTITEEIMVDIWQEAIGIERVGIHDQFMELGGDSLRASQVIAHITHAFGVDLALTIMFELATVAKIAIMIDRRQNKSAVVDNHQTIVRQAGNKPYELSYGQHRMWFIHQLDKNNLAYNMPKLIKLTGRLNIDALQESITTIISRHEVLRTNFQFFQDAPMAIIKQDSRINLAYYDLSDFPVPDRESELQRLVAEDSMRPFDLEDDLMLRCALYKLNKIEHILLCVTHHIASDGWSSSVLITELAAHYEANLAGGSSTLPELPIQYSDYAHWQRQQQQTKALELQMEYWMQCLHNTPKSLHLPTDYPHPATQSSKGRTYIFTVPHVQAQALGKLALDQRATMFMLLLTAFKILLYRITSQEDLVVGCPISGRGLLETEKLIGFFVNTLVLRTNLASNPTFRQLLGRVREQAFAAYANPDVPFERLVQHLRPERNLKINPLVQVMFDVHHSRIPELQTSEVNFQPLEVRRQMTAFDQTWNITITDKGLRVRIEYCADLFYKESIERMAKHYQTILNAILVNPDTTIYDLP